MSYAAVAGLPSKLVGFFTNLFFKIGHLIMATPQQLQDVFTKYAAQRDAIDAAKDLASAAKDATIKDLTAQLAAAAANAGVDPATVKALQDGIDAAFAAEQAALDALPVPPMQPIATTPPADPGTVQPAQPA